MAKKNRFNEAKKKEIEQIVKSQQAVEVEENEETEYPEAKENIKQEENTEENFYKNLPEHLKKSYFKEREIITLAFLNFKKFSKNQKMIDKKYDEGIVKVEKLINKYQNIKKQYEEKIKNTPGIVVEMEEENPKKSPLQND